MAVPALSAPDFVVVESDLAFGELEPVVDRPARPGGADELGQRRRGRGIDQRGGELVAPLGMAAQQHGVGPAGAERGPHRHEGPGIPPRPLGALAAAQPLPGGGHGGGSLRGDPHLGETRAGCRHGAHLREPTGKNRAKGNCNTSLRCEMRLRA